MNAYETWLKGKLQERGWTVLRAGWPDFLCFTGPESAPTKVMAVEGKMYGTSAFVSSDQERMMAILERAGISCRVIQPHEFGVDEALQHLIDQQYHDLRARHSNHKSTCRICGPRRGERG